MSCAELDVKDFGAAGDDVTDDTAAIQAAFNGLPAAGGTVCFPAGRYRVTSPVQVHRPFSMMGSGRDHTFIRMDHPTADIFVVQVEAPDLPPGASIYNHSPTISQLAFRPKVNRTGGTAIVVDQSTDVPGPWPWSFFLRIRDVVFWEEFDGIHIRADQLAEVSHCRFWNTRGTCIQLEQTAHPDAGGHLIFDCGFANDGVFTAAPKTLAAVRATSGGSGLRFIGNDISGRFDDGLLFTTSPGADQVHLQCTGNRFDHMLVACIRFGGSGIARQGVISGNQFILDAGTAGSAPSAIRFEPGPGGQVRSMLVASNFFMADTRVPPAPSGMATGVDIAPGPTARCVDVSVLGNHFHNFNVAGVRTAGQVESSRASGNTFSSTPTPYSVPPASTGFFPVQGGADANYLTCVGNVRVHPHEEPTPGGGHGVLELGTFALDAPLVTLGLIQFSDRAKTSGNKGAAAIVATLNGSVANNRGSQMDFYTKPDGAEFNAPRLRLDNEGNVQVAPGAAPGSYIEIKQRDAPAPAPAEDRARIYLRDNGGRTELVVQFSTGPPVRIAIQPP